MKQFFKNLFFDKSDQHLLRIVNEVVNRSEEAKPLSSLLIEHMHPQGIKELAAPRGLRIAYAVASLLDTLETGKAHDRIRNLRSLRDEVFLSTSIYYQKNTARVLLQIMKELLRSTGNTERQLKLAHDFRMVSTGRPRLVRAELTKYHLLEMPEEWNQYTFDHRVHDANTKGRKSPTHLVMDAWIKGIRYLTVVYYNHVSPEVVEELLEASSILDIKVQVGIEFSTRFRDKYAKFTWVPHGFVDNQAFLNFFKEESVARLMEEGQEVSRYQQRFVYDVFNVFNTRHRFQLNRDHDMSLAPLDIDEFKKFIGVGQPSVLHLARFIHNAIIACGKEMAETDGEDQERTLNRYKVIRQLSIEKIIDQFLLPKRNPEVTDVSRPSDAPDLPAMLKIDPMALLVKLRSLHSSSYFTLNLGNLSVQDTLELLYGCEGLITHIEVYNLKDAFHGIAASLSAGGEEFAGEAVELKSPEHHYRLINELQEALANDNVIGLKRAIRAIIWDFEEQRIRLRKRLDLINSGDAAREKLDKEYGLIIERKQQLVDILYHLEPFHECYINRVLGSHIGSSSSEQTEHQYGMGLVVLDTLPGRARRAAHEGIAKNRRILIPATAMLTRNSHLRCHDATLSSEKMSFLQKLPYLAKSGCRQWKDWTLDKITVHPGKSGNVATLGGFIGEGLKQRATDKKKIREKTWFRFRYLNTNLKNSLKVLIGFIPAFLTFSLTKDWWLLAYFGAFIWFGITGSRNIIQSVLGGGGLRRSPLLPWNSLVSWSRIADSLLFTGFSVPLLDYLVKTLLLDRGFGITTATDPILLYAVMGLANGIYISSHNLFRGLPKSAAFGNFFRSILAIPLAVVLNTFIGVVIGGFGVSDVSGVLQKWAAIISKFASDCVAAVIEGLADRQTGVRARIAAYRIKIAQLFTVFSRLDMLFPEEDVLDMLKSPKIIMETLSYEAKEQEKLIIVNALDLMYFWMYQPRARKALEQLFDEMTYEEWLIFYRSQLVLKRDLEISRFFVDGLVGRNFPKALSFYLERFEQYLADMEKLGKRKSA